MHLSEHLYCVAVAFKMTEWVEQWICIKFCVKIKCSSLETIQMLQKATAMGNWWLVLNHDNVPPHASCLMQSFLVKCQITQVTQPPYIPYLAPYDFWLFPKLKITFEREEISDHQWDSGKYDGTAHGNWENSVRTQGAYFEGDQGVIVLCTMFLVPCIFFNKCLYFSYYMAGYFLHRPCCILLDEWEIDYQTRECKKL